MYLWAVRSTFTNMKIINKAALYTADLCEQLCELSFFSEGENQLMRRAEATKLQLLCFLHQHSAADCG